VLAWFRDAKRDRLIFDQQLIDELGIEAETLSAEIDDRRRALRLCMVRLGERERKLLRCRYELEWSIKRIAGELGLSPGAVATSLYRIRNELLLCIEKKLDERGQQ
jgi:RNA polymerase sigma-70 factor (ECF subfamily)